jgi:hypothetical protein
MGDQQPPPVPQLSRRAMPVLLGTANAEFSGRLVADTPTGAKRR